MKRLPFLLSALTFVASLLGLAAVAHQHGVQTFGAVSGLPDPALDPRPNPFAVNVALEQYTGTGGSETRPFIDAVLDSLSGFHWLRQTFPWDEIEPARGEFRWATWDNIVAR